MQSTCRSNVVSMTFRLAFQPHLLLASLLFTLQAACRTIHAGPLPSRGKLCPSHPSLKSNDKASIDVLFCTGQIITAKFPGVRGHMQVIASCSPRFYLNAMAYLAAHVFLNMQWRSQRAACTMGSSLLAKRYTAKRVRTRFGIHGHGSAPRYQTE